MFKPTAFKIKEINQNWKTSTLLNRERKGRGVRGWIDGDFEYVFTKHNLDIPAIKKRNGGNYVHVYTLR